MAQLAERFRFNLPNALARDGEVLPHFFERVLATVADAKAHLDDALFARRQRFQHRLRLLLQVQVDHRLGGRDHLTIFDEVAKMRIFLFADRRFERNRLLRDLQHLADLRHRNVHPLCNFFRRRLAAELLHERARGADELVDRLDHVHRDADRARLVRNRAGNRLPDPPRRIRRELVPAAIFELVDRLHQADVAFLNQVEELQTAVGVFLRNRHDETEVGFDQLLLRLFGLHLAAINRVEGRPQMLGALLELVGAHLDRGAQLLDPALHVLLVFFFELRRLLALGVHLPLDALGLTLDLPDRLDFVLDLLDEPALDELGELDLAHELRQLDLRAHYGPPRLAIFPLLARVGALRRFVQLLFELLHDRALLADRINLLEHFLRALIDPLIGDLIVLEDHELADGPGARLQLITHVDDHLGDGRRARNRFDDGELAALDTPRDLDFSLAGEQRHGAHLAQVHADRIVGLIQRPGREVELHFLAALGRPVELLLLEVRLLGVDDFDARTAKRIEQIVELVRRGDLGRQQFVDLVVQQIAFFLSDGNQLPYFVVFFFNRQAFLLQAPVTRTRHDNRSRGQTHS